jgi:hypothetical protein
MRAINGAAGLSGEVVISAVSWSFFQTSTVTEAQQVAQEQKRIKEARAIKLPPQQTRKNPDTSSGLHCNAGVVLDIVAVGLRREEALAKKEATKVVTKAKMANKHAHNDTLLTRILAAATGAGGAAAAVSKVAAAEGRALGEKLGGDKKPLAKAGVKDIREALIPLIQAKLRVLAPPPTPQVVGETENEAVDALISIFMSGAA